MSLCADHKELVTRGAGFGGAYLAEAIAWDGVQAGLERR
jgi:hypothetical protein